MPIEGSSKAKLLTPKQQAFVREYLIDLNATQAAIRAGYSPKTANASGPRLLVNVGVQKAIAEAKSDRVKSLEITAERILLEYARVGFADVRSIASVKGKLRQHTGH